jgi:glycerol-1-phosphate dehydrogenase [NAD(P)+]
MSAIYKSAAPGCIALQNKIGNYTAERGYLQKEDGIRAILAEMPTANEIERMLSLVGLDMEDFYRFYGSERIENAILYAKDLKDRYTVLWVNYDFYGGNSNV